MKYEKELQSLGLHKSQISVYLFLLENGLSSVPQIAEGTNIGRTNCYHVLRTLEELGLIENRKENGRAHFFAKNPASLLELVSKNKEQIEKTLPDLHALYTFQKNKPKIRFFDGWEEVKQIYEETLTAEKIIAIGSTEKLSALELKFFTWYTNQLAKRKIIFNDILTHASKFHTAEEIKRVRGALHQIKFLPARFKDAPTDILIWNENIALIVLEPPIFGTVFSSHLFAQSFRDIFEILWEKL